jgi:hypothetical protein
LAQQTAYNGVRYSFTDINVEGNTAQQFGGVNFSFPKGVLQSLNWDATQDAGIVQGNQIAIVGRTNGYGSVTSSMELLVSEADDWLKTITSNGTYPILSVFFDLRITYSVNGTDVRVDTLQGNKLTKLGSANQKGNDATTNTFEMSTSKAYKNGLIVFGDPAT